MTARNVFGKIPAAMNNKDDIRREILAKRRALEKKEKESLEKRIFDSLKEKLANFKEPRVEIAAYLATDDELNIDPLLRYVAENSEQCDNATNLFVPRWNRDKKQYELVELFKAEALTPENIPLGHYAIREPAGERTPANPEDIDIWLIPGVAFAKDGTRLGYGGGYYDRFLSKAAPGAHKFGIAFPFQILESLPSEPHDIKVDVVMGNWDER